MTRSKFVIGLYILAVFASGVLAGSFGYRLYTARTVSASAPRNPEEYRKRYVNEMETRLKLNPDQVQKLNLILDATRNEFREYRERHRDEFRSIQDGQVRKINELLSPEQRAEYQRMREERDRHSRGKH